MFFADYFHNTFLRYYALETRYVFGVRNTLLGTSTK
jgi:hypothetical protein